MSLPTSITRHNTIKDGENHSIISFSISSGNPEDNITGLVVGDINKVVKRTSDNQYYIIANVVDGVGTFIPLEKSSNKVTTIGGSPSDDNYPSELLLKTELDLKEDLDNKVADFQETPDDEHYPTEKLVKDNLNLKINVDNSTNNTFSGMNDFNNGELVLPLGIPTNSETATLTTSFGGDNDLTFTAKTKGSVGNDITISYINAGDDETLVVIVVDDVNVVITLETVSGVIQTTAQEIKDIIEGDVDANNLISVALVTDGTGVVEELVETNLSGGLNGTPGKEGQKFVDGDDEYTCNKDDYTTENDGWVKITHKEQPIIKNMLGNGVLKGFEISINEDDNTKFDISSGIAVHIDNTNNPEDPIMTKIVYNGEVGLDVDDIFSHKVTYVAIDKYGNIIQKASPYTPTERRCYIVLGAVVHSDLATINAINELPDVALDSVNQLVDLIDSLKNFNIEGNVFSGESGSLEINKSAGYIFKRGVGFHTDNKNPHTLLLSALNQPTNIRYRLSDGTEYDDTNVIEKQWEEVPGSKTAMSGNKWYIQRINLFSSNLVRIQHAQHEHNSLSEAFQGMFCQEYITENNITENGLLRAYLIFKGNITSFSQTEKFRFVEADRFGGSIGGGAGAGNTNLQLAYNNSEEPEILTDNTRGALTLKRGSASDADDVLEVKNADDDIKFKVNGRGDTTLNKLNITLTIINTATADIDLDSSSLIHVTHTSTGSVTLTIKTEALISGNVYIIKDGGLNANINNIVLVTEGSEKIEGGDDYSIETDGGSVKIYSDGSNWFLWNV